MTDGQNNGWTDRPTDGPTKRGVESRSARLKKNLSLTTFSCVLITALSHSFFSLASLLAELRESREKVRAEREKAKAEADAERQKRREEEKSRDRDK